MAAIPAGILSPLPLVVLIASAQWMLFLARAIFSRRSGAFDRPLAVSSVVFLAVWLFVLAPPSFSTKEPVAAASIAATPSQQHGTCASIDVGMTGDQVLAKLGKPSRERAEEDVRGPKAVLWEYSDSQCSVHMLDAKVDFVD